MTHYHLTEGSLSLPVAARDESITLLRLTSLNATLTITREWGTMAEDVERYLPQQLERFSQELPQFTAEQITEAQLGEFTAQQVDACFRRQQIKVVQKLLLAWVGDHLLTLAFSAPDAFTPEQLQGWREICASFQPHQDTRVV